MDLWVWIVGAIVVGGIITAAMNNAEGNDLATKFAALGTLTGRTREEIIAAVGEQPTSVSSIGENQTLVQWQKTGYHIALAFTGDICDGVTHETLIQS